MTNSEQLYLSINNQDYYKETIERMKKDITKWLAYDKNSLNLAVIISTLQGIKRFLNEEEKNQLIALIKTKYTEDEMENIKNEYVNISIDE